MDPRTRKPVVLITGANGELGHGLIKQMSESGRNGILALDLNPISPEIEQHCRDTFQGDILDRALMERIVSQYEVHEIYHLAALLSTRAEFTPETAHKVNVDGTMGLLQLAIEQSSWRGEPVRFLFPSSIAVYGMRDLESKNSMGPVKEHEWTSPTTMYGCNKLYCENLGRYYARFYRQLAATEDSRSVDFRSIRFPGLISADTLPSGGTSDYGPEMLHAAAQGNPYACFVRPDTIIPFMAMPDAVDALLDLAGADVEDLSRTVYNITSFSLTAEEFREQVVAHFPGADISFGPDLRRQGIVDTWPAYVDDSAARSEWGFSPKYDLERAFRDYLVPSIRRRYE
ncbi:MAG: GDP-mannose 4,6-dehydratase [Candidatus Eisenbacteria bacterium]|uniref:GDP-mannose 4,6-dehydratase n=1 Tax=Eiseniibacteriota bacterium TaxID=2212470 RepID=A0A956NG65_UNCEI|nr:GDP-mannose 4,6-dehydratase [Candidatus Eisenbacteria bacterium]MCB9464961.1 GDP-mannose 4,6-dehydratase [Candidatus Eisenbacteria bacterium]